jgi:shikimate kinase
MRNKNKRTYFVIYPIETDDDVIITSKTGSEIRELASKMFQQDFAIIEGRMIKNFGNKTDLSRL